MKSGNVSKNVECSEPMVSAQYMVTVVKIVVVVIFKTGPSLACTSGLAKLRAR